MTGITSGTVSDTFFGWLFCPTCHYPRNLEVYWCGLSLVHPKDLEGLGMATCLIPILPSCGRLPQQDSRAYEQIFLYVCKGNDGSDSARLLAQ